MGHTTAFVLTAGQLLGIVTTFVGVVVLYFRDSVVSVLQGRR